MKIAMIGGHLTPALSFIDYLRSKHPQDQIVFIGRLYTQERERQPAQERELVLARGVTFIPLRAGKLDWSSPLTLLKNLGYAFASLPTAWRIVRREKPDVVLSFGGYLAVPVALAAKIGRIRLIIHEQTQRLGLANALTSFLADQIALSKPPLPGEVVKGKAVVTGNLLRPGILVADPPLPSWWRSRGPTKILYVTGGSQGSEILNYLLLQLLPILTKQWFVIHQCGPASAQRNYLSEAQQVQMRLTPAQRRRYHVQEWYSEAEQAWIYQQARLAISRAGANTVDELAYHALPSILIPLPFSHRQEQYLNAQVLSEGGGARLLEQKDASAETLLTLIPEVDEAVPRMRQALKRLPKVKGAPARLYQLLLAAEK